MSTVDDIFNAAQSLAPAEQWALVHRLCEAMPGEAWKIFDEAEIAELDRRMEEIESGKIETIPWSEARRQMYARLKRNG